MHSQVRDYYSQNYGRLCSLGQDADRVLRIAAAYEKYELPPSCNPQPGFIFSLDEKYRLRWWDLAVMALLYLPLSIALDALDRLDGPPMGNGMSVLRGKARD
jgi:hypothetical protein